MRILVDEGPGRVNELIALGAVFDRETTGSLALAREGGHSRARVVHAGGAATGAEVERALVDATYRSASAVLEGWFALDLVVEGGRCVGVTAPCRPTAARVPSPSSSGPRTSCWPPAAPARCIRSPPTRPSRRATGWPWRSAPACPRPTSSSSSSTRPHCTTPPCRGRCSPRRCAGTARCCATRRRALRRRAGAARRGQPGHGGAHGHPGRRPPLARCDRPRAFLPALPDHCGLAGLHRPRPREGLAPHRAGRPPPLGWRGDRPVGCHRAARAVGGRRGGLHRRARRQPPGLQLAARGHGLRRPPGRADRRRDRRARGQRCTAARPGGHAPRRHRVHRRWPPAPPSAAAPTARRPTEPGRRPTSPSCATSCSGR